MNGHQVRHAQLYCAISEAILTSYGWVPFAVREDIVAHAIAEVIFYQAEHENWVRDQATKGGYTPEHVADMVEKLHAPIGEAVV